MRTLKAVLFSSVISIAVVLCLAGSAMAAITSAQASVSVNPADPTLVQVYSSYSQDPVDQTISVSNFIMPRWDESCSQAGYPELENGGHPNGVIDGPDDATFNTNVFEHVSNFTLNPINQQTCIGTVAYTGSQVVVDAYPFYYNSPYFEYSYESTTSDSITIGFDLTPNGLATSYRLSYFKRNLTPSDCHAPDPADLATAQMTDEIDVTTDLDLQQSVSATISGLDLETEYCVSWHSENVAGSTNSLYWNFMTLGDVPVIENETYSGGVASIDFSMDVTPGITTSDTGLTIEYFERLGATCAEPGGPTSTKYVNYEGPGGVGMRGFDPIHITDTIEGLSSGATYCVRALASNAYGEADPTTFQAVATVNKMPASISNFQLSPGPDDDFPTQFSVSLNDQGAWADTNDFSDYEYAIFENTPERCNADDYFGGDQTIGGSSSFSGDSTMTVPFSDFVPGQAYCLFVHVDSAWGDDYDADAYFAYYGGSPPVITDAAAAAENETITVTGKVDPGYQDAQYGVLSIQLSGSETCDGPFTNPEVFTFGDVFDLGLTGPQDVSVVMTPMETNTRYCVRLVADSDIGYDEADWIEVTTGDALDTSPPSVPTNLAASNVTQTSATLSWSAAIDDVAVTKYDVIDGDTGLVGSTASTSMSVSLACGQTSQFHVTAFDAEGNESDKSDTIDITGLACDVPPPSGGGGTTPPPAKQCVKPITKKTVTGKSGKKKISVTVSGKVAADGQSIVISTKVKGTKVTFKVNGKKVTATKGAITLKNNPSLTTVTFKVGKKTKSIKVQTSVAAC